MFDALWRVLGHSKLPFSSSLLARAGVLRNARGGSFAIPWRGITYHGELSRWIDRHIYFVGSYSPAELDFIEQAALALNGERTALTMLDIGANVGQHSLAAQRFFDRVLAFEPSARVAERLRLNVARNGITNIEVHDVALGDTDGSGQLGSGFPGNDGSRSLHWTLNEADTEKVFVRRGDDYLRDLRPPVERIDLIKLDVEGHEKSVFLGLSERLSKDRPVILFELVGADLRGGFTNEDDVRRTLYPNHHLFALKGREKAHLEPFTWSRDEELVCIPQELLGRFEGLLRKGR